MCFHEISERNSQTPHEQVSEAANVNCFWRSEALMGQHWQLSKFFQIIGLVSKTSVAFGKIRQISKSFHIGAQGSLEPGQINKKKKPYKAANKVSYSFKELRYLEQ